MTRSLRNAYLAGYKTGNTSVTIGGADYLIPQQHIQKATITTRAQDLKDNAKFTITNPFGTYSQTVDHGDRLEFYVEDEGVPKGGSRYGYSSYGQDSYHPSPRLEWTGFVRPYYNVSKGAGLYELNVTCEDYVYAVLGSRRFWGAFNNAPVSGQDGAVLNEALEKVPEIDTTRVEDLGATMTARYDGVHIIEVLKDCIDHADAFAASEGTKLIFTDPSKLAVQFTTGYKEGDYANERFRSNDDQLINAVRVKGGGTPELEAFNEEVSSFGTISKNQYQAVKVDSRKGEIAKVEVYTKKTGFEEDFIVALQTSNATGDAPVAPLDSRSDIARRTLDYRFVDSNGWTTFLMPEHSIPGTNPWIVARGSGDDGQEVGLTSGGDLSHKAYFEFPAVVSVTEPDSIGTFGQRDGVIKDDSLLTHQQVEEMGKATLRHESVPRRTLLLHAVSDRMHHLRQGELFHVNDPRLGTDSTYVCEGQELTYEGNRLYTKINAEDIATFAAPREASGF